MSIRALNWLLYDLTDEISRTEFAVLVPICDRANEHDEAWPALKSIALASRTSVAEVRRTLADLTARGILTKLTVGSGRANSRYRVNIGRVAALLAQGAQDEHAQGEHPACSPDEHAACSPDEHARQSEGAQGEHPACSPDEHAACSPDEHRTLNNHHEPPSAHTAPSLADALLAKMGRRS